MRRRSALIKKKTKIIEIIIGNNKILARHVEISHSSLIRQILKGCSNESYITLHNLRVLSGK